MKISILLFALIPIAASGQNVPSFPVSDDNKIQYEEVVRIDSASKEEIYTASKKWAISAFNNAQNVIQQDDKASGELIMKGNYSKMVSSGMWGENCTYYFTITINCKEGRYKYCINDLQVATDRIGKQPAEQWVSGVVNQKKIKALQLAQVNDFHATMGLLSSAIKGGIVKLITKDNW